MGAPAPFLVIQHEAKCPPGNLIDRAARAGVGLDVRRPFGGEGLPEELTGCRGLIVLGGGRGAHDDEAWPWLSHTRHLIREAVQGSLPMLGICLGHQLAAVALGGDIKTMDAKIRGVRPFGLTAQGKEDDLFARLRPDVATVQWNGDTVDPLPAGGVALARDEAGNVQAARFAPRAWGVQSHPEVTTATLDLWVRSTDAPYVEVAAQAAADVARELPAIDAAWEEVLAEFFALG